MYRTLEAPDSSISLTVAITFNHSMTSRAGRSVGNVTLQGLDRDFELPDWGKARVLGLHYLEAVQSLLWCECAISYIFIFMRA
jgi:hypothetical protein